MLTPCCFAWSCAPAVFLVRPALLLLLPPCPSLPVLATLHHSIACTLQLVTFFFIAIFALHPHDYHKELGEEYPHFFKMPVLMLILITVLNDGTLISVAYDHVKPSRHPEKWNLKVRLCGRSGIGVHCVVSWGCIVLCCGC